MVGGRDIVVSIEMGYSLASGYRDTQKGYCDTIVGGLHLRLVEGIVIPWF